MVNDLLSVIVRFHNPKTLPQLDEALFSLSVQSYSKIQVILVIQNGEPSLVKKIQELLERHPFETPQSDYEHHIFSVSVPAEIDGRSKLLNEGIAKATGQYLAFLDYDDVIYPDSYRILIDRKAPIAVGGCTVAIQRLVSENEYLIESKRPYLSERKNQLDLFSNNFIPIHSFVIDRSQIDPSILHFNTDLKCFEDYEVLLRLAARYRFDFELLATPVAEYRIRNDGSNTIPTESSTAQVKEEWNKAHETIQMLRKNLLVQIPASDIANFVQERDRLLVERNPHLVRLTIGFVDWTRRYPRLVGFFRSSITRIIKNLRRIRILIFRSIRYND